MTTRSSTVPSSIPQSAMFKLPLENTAQESGPLDATQEHFYLDSQSVVRLAISDLDQAMARLDAAHLASVPAPDAEFTDSADRSRLSDQQHAVAMKTREVIDLLDQQADLLGGAPMAMFIACLKSNPVAAARLRPSLKAAMETHMLGNPGSALPPKRSTSASGPLFSSAMQATLPNRSSDAGLLDSSYFNGGPSAPVAAGANRQSELPSPPQPLTFDSTVEIAEMLQKATLSGIAQMKKFENASAIYLEMTRMFNNAGAVAAKSMMPLPESDPKKEPRIVVNPVKIGRAFGAIIDKYMDTKGARYPFTKEALAKMTPKEEYDLYQGARREDAENWASKFGLPESRPGQPSPVIVQRGDKWCVTMDMSPVLKTYAGIPGLYLQEEKLPHQQWPQFLWYAPDDTPYDSSTIAGEVDKFFEPQQLSKLLSQKDLVTLTVPEQQAWRSNDAIYKEMNAGTLTLNNEQTRTNANAISSMHRTVLSLIQSLFETNITAYRNM